MIVFDKLDHTETEILTNTEISGPRCAFLISVGFIVI